MNKYDFIKLRPLTFVRFDDISVISIANGEILSYKDPKELIIRVGSFLNGTYTFDNISEKLIQEVPEITNGDIIDIIENIFIDNNLIIDSSESLLSNRDESKYDRIINTLLTIPGVDKEKAQKAIKRMQNSHVLVLGVGGTGGHIAHSLIATGLGRLTIVDFDRIELSNITRQILYNESDIGSIKVEVAKKRLQAVNKDAMIDAINMELKSREDIVALLNNLKWEPDFVISCIDNPRGAIRYFLDSVFYDKGIPIIYNGSDGTSAFAGPLIYKEQTPSLTNLVPPSDYLDPIVINANDNVYLSNVIEPMNGVAAYLTSFETIKFLTGIGFVQTMSTELVLDLLNMTFKLNKLEELDQDEV